MSDRRPDRIVRWLPLLTWVCLTVPVFADEPARDLADAGRRIYEEGILTDGQPLSAVAADGIEIRGANAACRQCHRRSGMGSHEGDVTVAPIAAPLLFARPTAAPGRAGRPAAAPQRRLARPAYDDETLARAIRTGVDPSGQPLHPLMPRYRIDDAGVAALLAHLKRLGSSPAPGVAPGVMRLATIITDEAEPAQARIVAETLRAWAARGAVSHLETPLDIWRLEGPPSIWRQQLYDHYRRQPVFAVVGGLAGAHWQPVEEFCEATALPCVFPIVDAAPERPGQRFNFYLSPGVTLEARMLAEHLANQPAVPLNQVVTDDAGRQAAAILAARLPGAAMHLWDRSAVPGSHVPDDGVLVAWLRPREVESLLGSLAARPTVYLSARLSPPERVAIPPAWRPHVRWLSARADPAQVGAGAAVTLAPWAAYLHLPVEDQTLQAEIHAAAYFFSDALARMRGHWQREYLLESIETGMYGRAPAQFFHGLSLGAGQRTAAKGGYLLGFAPPEYRTVVRLGGRLVP
jgi:hypothetical protein